MLNGNVYYHGLIRKTIVAFGRLFSDIRIPRYDNDGVLQQTVAVPIAYAPKEKWIVRIESDPNLENHTYTVLPRLSFEITGYAYDSLRKVNRMNKLVCVQSGGDTRKETYAPVPYNLDITLYALTKNTEDGLAIVEQILPTFTPEYTLAVNAVSDMNIVQDIPIILNSVSVQDDYDGDFNLRRFVTHTFNFTAKMNLFGNVASQGVINDVTASINQTNDPDETFRRYNATQSTPVDSISENWSDV